MKREGETVWLDDYVMNIEKDREERYSTSPLTFYPSLALIVVIKSKLEDIKVRFEDLVPS